MKEIYLIIISVLCSSYMFSQFYSPELDPNTITADDIPNIVQHLTNAKKLLITSNNHKELNTMPSVSAQLLYFSNVSDTSLLFNRIKNGETLEELITFNQDYEFIEDAIFYEIDGHIDYSLNERKSWTKMLPIRKTKFQTLGNKIVTLEQTDAKYKVLVMDKIVMPETKPINKQLVHFKSYAHYVLNPKKTIVRDSSIIKLRKKKLQELVGLPKDQNSILKAVEYYNNNVLDSDSFTFEERIKNEPQKRLINEDPDFAKLLIEAYGFAKEYFVTTDRFNHIVKPILTREEYYNLFTMQGPPKITNTACDFDDKMALWGYQSEVFELAFQADNYVDFFRMYRSIIRGNPFGGLDYINVKLEKYGLEMEEFVIGLTIGTAEEGLQYRLKEIASFIPDNKLEEIFTTALSFINDTSIDEYNKYQLKRLLGIRIGYISSSERKEYLTSKFGIEEIESSY